VKLTLLFVGIVVLAALMALLSGWCVFTLRDLLATTRHPSFGNYLVAGLLTNCVIASAAGTAIRNNKSKSKK
jgi:hypothetical protein